ncbi:MAG: GIY-YIG nuclease family protein [Methanobacteriaceae archaeon]|jgi:Uri superfamily endonuclease|nr:GIY-YIG nuclease family protein [Candidatus Methanorudis spinitermitis]
MQKQANPQIMKGTYCLIIHGKRSSKVRIGALGEICFKEGYYVYIGSAMNSLKPRIKRHLSTSKKIHWHIDYLLKNENLAIEEIIFNIGEEKIECKIANNISCNGEKMLNFGSSDCTCSSHLIYFRSFKDCLKNVKEAYKNLDINYYDLKYFREL